MYVARQVDESVGEQIAALGLAGVNVDPESKRILPGGDTGRSVIGQTDIDGVGIGGLELQFDDLLDGAPTAGSSARWLLAADRSPAARPSPWRRSPGTTWC